MLEVAVKNRDTEGTHPFGDELSDGVIDPRRRDRRAQPKARGEVRGDVELAAAHVNGALGCLAKGHDARIEPVHERAERHEIERAVRPNIESAHPGHYGAGGGAGAI